ncbi:MAG: Polysulfide reductase NrfD [Acidimicrobiales bacterium]|nr:Polysulfide reductase NrfD [Acidimicrobiales bacterium]
MPGERRMVPDATPQSYYGRPILKPPVWKWMVPAYFFSGGLAAGSSALALGAQLTRRPVLRRRARLVSLAAVTASGAFLVADLGRPSRFHHMLRVVKPTSPMSVGSWLLAIFGPTVGAAAMCDVLDVLPGVGDAAGVVAAAFSPAIATYTAALVSDTAVPAWHDAHSTLPLLFASGAVASAGAVGVIVTPCAEAGPARRMAIGGAVAEVAAAKVMEDALGDLVGRPYHEGTAGRLSSTGMRLTAAGAAVIALVGRRRWAAAVGGASVATGAALSRFAVFHGGIQSAADPEFTVTPQQHPVSAAR